MSLVHVLGRYPHVYYFKCPTPLLNETMHATITLIPSTQSVYRSMFFFLITDVFKDKFYAHASTSHGVPGRANI